MSLRSKKNPITKPSPDDGSQGPSLFVREVMAIFFLGAAAYLLLCLLTYDPLDPSLFTHSSGKLVQNRGGLIGAYVGDLFMNFFGLSSFFVGFLFLVLSVLLFAGYRATVHLTDMLVAFIFIILVSVLFELRLGDLSNGFAAGGMVGHVLADVAVSFLGRSGAYLLVVLGALVTFIWSTRLSLTQIFQALQTTLVKMFKALGQSASIAWARTKKYFERAKLNWQQEKNEKKSVQVSSGLFQASQKPLLPENSALLKSQKTPSGRPDSSQQSLASIEKTGPSQSRQNSSEGSRLNQTPPQKTTPFSLPAPVSKDNTHQEILPEEPARLEPRILERADKKKPNHVSNQLELMQSTAGYQLPPLSLLDSESQQADLANPQGLDEAALKMQSQMLVNKLMDFNVEGRVTEIHPGPVITMFEFEPAPGVKLSRISNLVDDLSLAMGGRSVRIVAPLPNKAAVGIEIPNHIRETVWLKDIIADDRFQKSESKLNFALGKDIEGIPYVSDLAKMPHLLVAGATGAGKSVSINSMIVSILYKARPEEVRLIMVDPKMLELSIYEGIPHLLLPVVTEPKKASLALRWAVREMERRYKMLADINARNILNYNKKVEKNDFVSRQAEQIKAGLNIAEDERIRHEGKLPYIVILIDELADLMMVSSREVEESITRLAQMARAAGLHLILATQRPSVDVLTGVIKANFPARISFKVSSKHDSRTILDTVGSEHLLGAGDMLFIPPGTHGMTRVHGAYITESEIGRIVDFLKTQAKPVYDESILKPIEAEAGSEGGMPEEENDALYDQAVALVSETRQASISMIQRRFRIGYNRAARMVEKMESEGIVSSPSGSGSRQVLVNSFEPK